MLLSERIFGWVALKSMIAIERLTKRFANVVALDRVDLNVKRGEMFFLFGPSGCGKTTLLRHIAGFYKPDEGRILFDGEDVTNMPPYKRNTAMVFQNYALWPHLTVEKNVAFGLEERRLPKNEIRTRVRETLQSVHLEHASQRKISELSGGQQQRVALARAMVVHPTCLLLDEPLSNLDAKLRAEMRADIRRICRDYRLTAVFVTHDQHEALSIADRIAVLDAGKILQIGTPTEIYRQPCNRLVAEYIGEANFLNARITGRNEFVDLDVNGFRLRAIVPSHFNQERPGSEITVCLRPEAIRISEEKSPDQFWQARLIESIYFGPHAQHHFSCGKNMLKVSESNPQPARLQIGGEYFLGVLPRDVVLFC
jgi:ABC-type Fe3+/spermidine/putrescine transport system ATPase subunit